MILNPNVNVDIEYIAYGVKFYPDDGYALWDDRETGNLDGNGAPIHYTLQEIVPTVQAEDAASHIWARLIEDWMEVFGNVTSPVDTMAEVKEKAEAYDILMGEAK